MCSSDLLFPIRSLYPSYTGSLQFLKYSGHIPASGPLHRLFSDRSLVPEAIPTAHSLKTLARKSPPQGDLPDHPI